MSEGELKKVIRLRNRYDTELALTTNIRLFTDDWQQMKEKLDEAKKEFLQWFDDNQVPEEADDLSDAMSDWAIEFAKWFKKWFGESK